MTGAELSTQGILLTRQMRDVQGTLSLFYWMATAEGPVEVVIDDPRPCFFVRTEDLAAIDDAGVKLAQTRPLSLTTFSGAPCSALYFHTRRDYYRARERLAECAIATYEADINPLNRFLMERFVTVHMAVSGTSDPVSPPRFRNPRVSAGHGASTAEILQVLSLDIETDYRTNTLLCIGVSQGDQEHVYMLGQGAPGDAVSYVDTEAQLIRELCNWIQRADPDVIIGWNVVDFDIRLLHERARALRVAFAIGRRGQEPEWRGGDQRAVLIPGRAVIEGIETMRTGGYQFESFALDHVGQQLLGRGKQIDHVDNRAEEIIALFENDPLALARYNLEDCRLVRDIFEQTDLLAFALERSRLSGLALGRPGGSVAAFDYLYLPRLHRAGRVAPNADDGASGASPGGYVLGSMPGIFENVVVLDFKSLYPSIIRTFHIDPLGLVRGLEQDPEQAVPGFRDGRFSREGHILPDLIAELWRSRDEAKAARRAPLSQAIKILMNSFYGVLGTPACRFFDARLASSITLRGHQIIGESRDYFSERGFTVIYGDTDSLFLQVQAEADQVPVIASALARDLNEWWRRRLREEYGVESCLEMEFETHFARFFMPALRQHDAAGASRGSKKRYAGLLAGTDELVFKGLEYVRSDWTALARSFQKELYRRVFFQQPYAEYVRSTVESVRSGEHDAQLVFRKRLRRSLDAYNQKAGPHVQAARLMAAQPVAGQPELRSGSIVAYVVTINGPQPLTHQTAALDYESIINSQLVPIADAILPFVDDSFDRVIGGQQDLF